MRFNSKVLLSTTFIDSYYRRYFSRFIEVNVYSRFYYFIAQCIQATYQPLEENRAMYIAFQQEVLVLLQYVYIFRYANQLLTQLQKGRYIYARNNVLLSKAQGAYGLSYSLITQLQNGQRLQASFPYLASSSATKSIESGFADFLNNIETRVQLLFNQSNAFKQGNQKKQLQRAQFYKYYNML